MPLSRRRRRRGRVVTGGRSATGTPITARSRKRRTNYLLLGAFIVIALLVIGSFGLTSIPFGRGGAARAGSSDRHVEGIGVQHPIEGATHVPEPREVSYRTTPPTSGNHWPRWANCGFYDEGLPDEMIVHNLEHGAIVVSYNLAAEDVARLRTIVDGIGLSQIWGVTRFYDKLSKGTVALAGWGVLDTMQGVDAERIKRFFNTYAGTLGPEKTQGNIGIPC